MAAVSPRISENAVDYSDKRIIRAALKAAFHLLSCATSDRTTTSRGLQASQAKVRPKAHTKVMLCGLAMGRTTTSRDLQASQAKVRPKGPYNNI